MPALFKKLSTLFYQAIQIQQEIFPLKNIINFSVGDKVKVIFGTHEENMDKFTQF